MVDWDQVEKLREKGWDWDRIAEDPRVEYRADSDVSEPGRALRALYFQRRSRQKRRPAGAKERSTKSSKTEEESKPKWTIARIGYILTPLFAIWFLLAFFVPSPFGVYLPAIPILGILLAVGGFLLAFGLLRTTTRWDAVYRKALVSGVVLGIVVVSGIGVGSLISGCPVLPSSANSSGLPDGWAKTPASTWATNGLPTFFFYGSIACPYCSASSWAMYKAIGQFGSVSGIQYSNSSSTDVYPNTPEVVLAYASLNSQHIGLSIAEATDNAEITTPATTCIQQAYYSAFGGGSIPFVVVNGQYYHAGATLVNPQSLAGLSTSEVASQVNASSGAAWNAISPQAFWIMAFLLKADGGQPSSIFTTYPQVKADYQQITV